MIEINNLTTAVVDKVFLEKIAKRVLKGERKEKLELSIALIGQKKIKELNKRYRGKNRTVKEDKSSFPPFAAARVTDVLSFDYGNSGEIVICLSEVRENAKRYNSTFKKELARVLIHGILHLLEYDHEKSEREARKMEKKENYYLKLCQRLIS